VAETSPSGLVCCAIHAGDPGDQTPWPNLPRGRAEHRQERDVGRAEYGAQLLVGLAEVVDVGPDLVAGGARAGLVGLGRGIDPVVTACGDRVGDLAGQQRDVATQELDRPVLGGSLRRLGDPVSGYPRLQVAFECVQTGALVPGVHGVEPNPPQPRVVERRGVDPAIGAHSGGP
jgi:hypothetical protein